MPDTKIDSATYGDLAGAETKFSVDPTDTDGPTDSKETEYVNTNWTKQLGYYKSVMELKSAIDALARWTIGKGFTADKWTTFRLMVLRGIGKDTLNTILENQTRVAKIGGDSFAEIVRNWTGTLVNLKPLNPGRMKTVVNKKGIIIRYEQIGQGKNKKFNPDQIFHLMRNRVADEIHGESLIDSVEEVILMRNEAMSTQRVVMRRYMIPTYTYKLDTDDTVEIAKFKATADAANAKGENIYIPMGAVEQDLNSVPSNATLNPLAWIALCTQLFYQATGVPQIITGGSQEMTEASAKIAYLAWEQTVEEEQLYIEEQVSMQLGLTIDLEFPASLQNEMLSGKKKEETMQASTPEDTGVTNVGI